jgi:hypothetical protein
MTRRISTFFIMILLLAACLPTNTPPAATQAAATLAERTAIPTRVPPPTPTPTASAVPTPSRIAAITLVEPLVEARVSASTDFSAAAPGVTLPVGGEARTGEAGRARLDLAPDGTIIRLAPNTHFTVAKLDEESGNPFTQLELFFGQIYIILSGGELQVQTPSGVASVRGSMMSVSYDPNTKAMTITCLEGHCSLRNDKGIIELVAGQAADILNGILSRGPRDLTDAEIFGWLENAPELNNFPDVLGRLRDRIDKLPKLPRRWPR